MAELGNGLSDFGLTNQNDATSVEGGPSLSDMLGDAVLDEVSNSKLLSAKIDELKGQDQPGLLDKILSTRGLGLLAATVGVGAAGGGGIGAAAFGLGAAQGVDQVVEAERSSNRAAIEKLEADRDASEAKLEKTRNRIATAFNTNPDAFLNEDGTPAIDSRVLGWYITGTDIPLFPQTRRLLNQRDQRWSKRMDVLQEALETTSSKEDGANIVRSMMRQMQWFDADEATIQSIVNSIGTDLFDPTFAATLARHGGSSAFDAMIFAGEEGLPLQHPEVLRRIKFQSDADALPPSQQLSARFINDIETVNKFSQNPINAEFVMETNRNNDPDEASKRIATQALESIGTGEVQFYLDKVNAIPPEEFRRLQQAYGMVSSKTGLIDTVRGVQSLKDALDMDDQQWNQYKMEKAQGLVQEAEAASRQSLANQNAALRNQTANSIQAALPNLGVSGIYGLVDKVTQAAMAAAKTTADGSVDRADFERLVSVYTQAAIEQNKQ